MLCCSGIMLFIVACLACLQREDCDSFLSPTRFLLVMQSSQYDLELEKAIVKIKAEKAKLVCIQLPDGLKPYANEIQAEIEAKTPAKVVIWAGSCYGSCDVPLDVQRLGVDLLLQWGHSEWR